MDAHADLFEFEDDGLDTGFTTVQNLFLTHFMPAAKGNYVKIYLAGLMRCYGSKNDQWASAKTIAEEQRVSVDVVRAAWRYWEKVGLIRRIPRYLRDPANPYDYRTEPDEEYCHQTTNIIRFRRDLRPLIEQTLGGMQNCTRGVCNSTQGGYAKLHTKERQVEEPQGEEGQDQTKVSSGPLSSRILSQFESHIGRPPSKSERRTLQRLVETYGEWWVDSAFTEYLCQSDLQQIKVPLRYIEGVLENWSVEGMRLTDVVQHLRRLKGGKT